jgi:hypothetical protein
MMGTERGSNESHNIHLIFGWSLANKCMKTNFILFFLCLLCYHEVLSPHQNMSRDGFMPTNIYYDPKMVQKAWASMLQVPSDSSFWSSHLFFYDVVDIGRQVLSDEFFAQSMNLAAQIQNKDKNAVQKISTRMLQLMDDLDLLLSTDKNWMLGPWLERAKKKGKGNMTCSVFDNQPNDCIVFFFCRFLPKN